MAGFDGRFQNIRFGQAIVIVLLAAAILVHHLEHLWGSLPVQSSGKARPQNDIDLPKMLSEVSVPIAGRQSGSIACTRQTWLWVVSTIQIPLPQALSEKPKAATTIATSIMPTAYRGSKLKMTGFGLMPIRK